MNKQIFRSFAISALSALLVASCSKEPEAMRTIEGEPTTLGLSFSVPAEQTMLLGEATPDTYSITNPGTDTEEGTVAGYAPEDVWMIQYNGTTDAATIVGVPRYVDLGSTTNVQAVTSTVANTLVFVANTHDANLEWGNINTLADMKKACKAITAETDCYGNNYSTTKDLVMSGTYQGVISTGTVSAELVRNIARIDFTLVNGSGSAMTLKSVQLCNVPRNFYWTAGLIDPSATYPAVSDYFDYPVENLTGAMNPGGSQTLTWYMPLNQKGTVSASTDAKTKPAYAPSYATYIRILATNAQNEAYVYKIYPGGDLIANFDLKANHKYRLDITINSSGDASTDGRVENFAKVEFASANSYILNPAPAGTADRVFTIPVGRLNEFWAGTDPNRTVKDDTAWTAELLWQDTPTSDFIRFVDLSTGALSTTQSGTGLNERIAVTTKAGYAGNALICLKVGGEIRWSWHLWVTDYDPSYSAAPVDGQYIYSVTGGEVHRYSGTYWADSAQGRYKTKYIMDRNFGARTAEYSTVGALYYQFGRKDPQPMIGNSNQLYDINGATLSYTGNNTDAGTGVTFAEAVLNPTKFYTKSATNNYGDWSSEGKTGTYAWNNTVAGADLKSIFDPCPPGWKLPVNGLWSDFYYNATAAAASCTTHNTERDPKLGWSYNGTNGLRYWPKSSEVAGSIYYPAVGYRYVASGAMSNVTGSAFCWSSSPSSAAGGYFLSSYSTGVYPSGGNYRALGFPVRCVQE